MDDGPDGPSSKPGLLHPQQSADRIREFAFANSLRGASAGAGASEVRMEYIAHYKSPLGGITMAGDGTALTGLWFDGQKYYADTLEPEHEERLVPVLEETRDWLELYFSGNQPPFTPPIRMKATAFRKRVWEIMMTIPYGQTMTYSEIARIIAAERGIQRMSAQAVGGAVGHNSISLIIPCHRVVGADGSLTGYAGRIGRKERLLRMEGVNLSGLYVPKRGTAL